jgi:hypothetical protein
VGAEFMPGCKGRTTAVFRFIPIANSTPPLMQCPARSGAKYPASPPTSNLHHTRWELRDGPVQQLRGARAGILVGLNNSARRPPRSGSSGEFDQI